MPQLACNCAAQDVSQTETSVRPVDRDFIQTHCAGCHGQSSPAGEVDLVAALESPLTAKSQVWERALRKISTHQMPPEGEPAPSNADRDRFVQQLAARLDQYYFEKPVVAKSDALRRLNRTEYQNSIRDLLGIEFDAATLLPPDESSNGFDNITVTDLSPVYLDRAITAAQKISHLAIGAVERAPGGETYRVRPDITQDTHMPGLPIGSRGGIQVQTQVARPGYYEFTVRLTRDRNEEVEGLNEPHDLEVSVDRVRVELFKVKPPPDRRDFSVVDKHLKTRTFLAAGKHTVTVTFLRKSGSLLETKRQPYNAHYNMHRHPRLGPAIYEVSVTGPFPSETQTSGAEWSSSANPMLADLSSERSVEQAARQWLGRILRIAYRRPVTEEDLAGPLKQFANISRDHYPTAVQQALASVLVSPHFLLKLERAPTEIRPGQVHRISDLELASRLSFFLWSSLPDEALLELAEQNRLHEPEILAAQVERMLRDRRSQNLVDNFAEQWLYLRNLESMTPDLRSFPDFDDNLRQAFRQETKLCFEELLREDRSVLELIKRDHTYLNERLAKHYGVPHVYGSRFRRVDLEAEDHRGGLLRQGSILTVTSYATRTSPVLRGHWVLKNIVGSPPPPPPANVPALKDNTVATNLSMRQRLAEHRAQSACAVCHNLLDPVGFCLENYDAVGRWRTSEEGMPLDVRGGLAGHPDFEGVTGLEEAILARPQLFVSTMVERLMTFALGRPILVEEFPAIRRVVRDAADHQYRFSQIIQGIVASPPFQLRCEP